MPQITFFAPDETRFDCHAEVGSTAMRVAVENDVPGILAICGGACSCSTCHVYVAPEWQDRVGGPGGTEGDLLDYSETREAGSRLACQIPVTADLDGLVLRVAPNNADLV